MINNENDHSEASNANEETTNELYPLYCLEDGIYILRKNSKEGILIQAAKDGKPKKVRKYLEAGVNKLTIQEAMDAALKNNNWEIAQIISDFCQEDNFEKYSECLKKQFLKASYNEDIEKVKFYLQKLIENIVGELTDEKGKSTLEIALKDNPADIILILSNYGFSEQSLNYAYKCMSNN